MDSLGGGLDDRERDVIGDALESIALRVFALGNQLHHDKQTEELQQKLIKNEIPPQNACGLLYFLGGHFGNHAPQSLDLSRVAPSYVFGSRSNVMLLEEAPLIARFLNDLQQAFPSENPLNLNLDAIKGELESLWRGISLYNQRQIQPQLATYCQHLAQEMQWLAERAKEKIFANKALEQGKQLPDNGLEALRWSSGYFHRKHAK
jgi:hypothetical protein